MSNYVDKRMEETVPRSMQSVIAPSTELNSVESSIDQTCGELNEIMEAINLISNRLFGAPITGWPTPPEDITKIQCKANFVREVAAGMRRGVWEIVNHI